MGDTNKYKATATPTIDVENENIVIDVHEELGNFTTRYYQEVVNLKDRTIRQALHKLGWRKMYDAECDLQTGAAVEDMGAAHMRDVLWEEDRWTAFRKTGLLLIVNQLLHIFGWAIQVEVSETGKVVRAVPIRTKARGFDLDSQIEAYQKVSEYMRQNADMLAAEANSADEDG